MQFGTKFMHKWGTVSILKQELLMCLHWCVCRNKMSRSISYVLLFRFRYINSRFQNLFYLDYFVFFYQSLYTFYHQTEGIRLRTGAWLRVRARTTLKVGPAALVASIYGGITEAHSKKNLKKHNYLAYTCSSWRELGMWTGTRVRNWGGV
jgi:hypothetical protein